MGDDERDDEMVDEMVDEMNGVLTCSTNVFMEFLSVGYVTPISYHTFHTSLPYGSVWAKNYNDSPVNVAVRTPNSYSHPPLFIPSHSLPPHLHLPLPLPLPLQIPNTQTKQIKTKPHKQSSSHLLAHNGVA